MRPSEFAEARHRRAELFEQELTRFCGAPGFIKVPLSLWVPDRDAVAFASLGRIHNFLIGWMNVKVREGILPGRFGGRASKGALGCKRHARIWARVFSPELSPNQLLEYVLQEFAAASVALRSRFHRSGRFDLVMLIGDPNSREGLALAERRFRVRESIVEHHWLQVVESAQQKGLSSRVFASLLPAYRMLGIFEVQMTAGLSAGGAVWARFGFVPETDAWWKIRPVIAANIEATWADIMFTDEYSPYGMELREALMSARELLEYPDPKVLWMISDIAVQHPGTQERLGIHLLRKTHWKGSLRFDDMECVTRLRAQFVRSGVACTTLDLLVATANRN